MTRSCAQQRSSELCAQTTLAHVAAAISEMPCQTELLDGGGGQSHRDDVLARASLPRKEAAGEVGRLPGRRVDRRLEVHAVMDVAQEEDDRPLVLTVAARRAERHPRFAVAEIGRAHV